jgi:hypothetical protein
LHGPQQARQLNIYRTKLCIDVISIEGRWIASRTVVICIKEKSRRTGTFYNALGYSYFFLAAAFLGAAFLAAVAFLGAAFFAAAFLGAAFLAAVAFLGAAFFAAAFLGAAFFAAPFFAVAMFLNFNG